MLEEARALANGVDDAVRDQHGADRLIAGAEPFRHADDVGNDALMLEGEARAATAHAAHHLVEDEKHAVTVANLADALEIAGHGGHGAERRADHRLGDEGHHRGRAELLDLRLELVGDARAIFLLRSRPARLPRYS